MKAFGGGNSVSTDTAHRIPSSFHRLHPFFPLRVQKVKHNPSVHIAMYIAEKTFFRYRKVVIAHLGVLT